MSKKTLLILTILIAIVNFISVAYFSVFTNRLIRLLTILFYFVLLFNFHQKYSKYVRLAFIPLIISSVLVFNYENVLFNCLTSLVKIVGYLLLFVIAIKKFNYSKTNKLIFIFFMFLALLNLYALSQLVHFVEHLNSDYPLHRYVIYTHGIVLLVLCFFTGNANFTKPSKRTLYFSLMVFGFAFSDLSAVLAYYFDILPLSIFHRFLFVFSCYYSVRYIMTRDYPKEKNYLK